MIKCSFCKAQVSHLGDQEFEAGWGRVTLHTQDNLVHMAHCPDHFDEFVEVLKRQIASKQERPKCPKD